MAQPKPLIPTATLAPATPEPTTGARRSSAFEAQARFRPYDRPTQAIFAEVSAQLAGMESAAPGYILTIIGRSGCGKTLIAQDAHRYAYYHLYRTVATFADRSVTGIREIIFRKWVNLVDALRSGTLSPHEWETMGDAWFLVIDDFGAENMTAYSKEKLLQLIDRRVGRWTLLNTNLSPTALTEQIDERLTSRLFREGGKVLHTTAQDFNRR